MNEIEIDDLRGVLAEKINDSGMSISVEAIDENLRTGNEVARVSVRYGSLPRDIHGFLIEFNLEVNVLYQSNRHEDSLHMVGCAIDLINTCLTVKQKNDGDNLWKSVSSNS